MTTPTPTPAPIPTGPSAPDRPATPAELGADATVLRVPLGQRVMVLGDLLLPAAATASSKALATDIALTLDQWEGPGTVIVCGNLFSSRAQPCGHELQDGASAPDAGTGGLDALAALDAHGVLTAAIKEFCRRADCRLLVLPGWRDIGAVTDPAVLVALGELGIEVVNGVDLEMLTAAGTRRVQVRSAYPDHHVATVVEGGDSAVQPWLDGIDRLEDPSSSNRFVTSRTLYRRFGRYVWIPPIVALLVAVVIRMAVVFHGVERLVRREAGVRKVLLHAYSAPWSTRLLFLLGVVVVLELAVALAVAWASRRFWRSHGGGELASPWDTVPRYGPEVSPASSGLDVDGDDALDHARAAVAGGAAGLVVGGRLRAELTHLGPGFFACPGGTSELVREHRGRLGLPPVFLHHRQASAIELESGADLHVRLLLADVDLPSSTTLERLATGYRVVKGYKAAADLHPGVKASWPHGDSWPPAPGVAADRVRVRRVRRLASAAIFAAGLVDLIVAVNRPLASHLHVVREYLPLGIVQAAGALVALAGIALMMLARGILRGQRRAWVVAVALLAATTVLHVLHGASPAGLILTVGVLLLLLTERELFRSAGDRSSWLTAAVTLVGGAVLAVGLASSAIEVNGSFRRHTLPSWPLVLLAVVERMVGLQTVALVDPVNDWVAPSMLAVGIGLAVVTLYLLTRPVVDRTLSSRRPGSDGEHHASRRAAELRARDIVRRHGTGTLDYFALRDDKQWFFHRDSLVAYAVYGGVCLVSPDPIGPHSERLHVWDAFRRFCDRRGWGVAVIAAAEEWLPIYRSSGMRHVYIGDEAVVDVQRFSLAGGKMKGLRQAVARVERYGYTVEFFDPSAVPIELANELVDLMGRNRRGNHERGFSMMLGRIFDQRDAGLLLTVVFGPGHDAVAMCQFVPSAAIRGYSLDLMRRDPGEHPNGLLDYALCSTIEHLRAGGQRGLSLNFAAMRSTLEGESGDGITQRLERWALKRMSTILQIESLWRFNAKYEPSWLPRYVVFDSAEQFAPTLVTILRAEAMTEVPVIGRLLVPSAARRRGLAASVPAPGPGDPSSR
ncbi:MAG: phosphatidylglycerol lysyltransferase domain-containing protein [Actinomycetota bacterium]|nr:phosphatidylglycerol lysyltransferase domain-containing protein [Actinomycetota bacterium]